MLTKCIILFLFGGVGVVLRYFIYTVFPKYSEFPLATFLVNMSGAFTLGLLAQHTSKESSIWLWSAVGFCGGLTTFSGVSMELYQYIVQNQFLYAVVYATLTILLGIVAFWSGMHLIKT